MRMRPAITDIPVIELWDIKRKYDLIVSLYRKRFVWNCVCFGEGFWEEDGIREGLSGDYVGSVLCVVNAGCSFRIRGGSSSSTVVCGASSRAAL